MTPKKLFARARLVFWDFDGVIKDSLEVKGRVFSQLFRTASPELIFRIRAHHAANGGMSRYEKIPLYLHWSGETPTDTRVHQLCKKMESLVIDEVINSPWVPGVEKVLRKNVLAQKFVVVSATPMSELTHILGRLDLAKCFSKIYGSPLPKAEALATTLTEQKLAPEECLMIGDAQADINAAMAHSVPFLLRRHNGNNELIKDLSCPYVNDFVCL